MCLLSLRRLALAWPDCGLGRLGDGGMGRAVRVRLGGWGSEGELRAVVRGRLGCLLSGSGGCGVG